VAAEHFPDHRPDALCPVCGWKEWQQVAFAAGEVDNPVAAITTYPRAMYPVAALPLYCTRCGFVRLHVKPRK